MYDLDNLFENNYSNGWFHMSASCKGINFGKIDRTHFKPHSQHSEYLQQC